MSAENLPTRIGYAAVAFLAVAAAGFYATIWLAPRFTRPTTDDDGYELFRTAIGVAVAVGFSAALAGLTLPWKRRKRRSGRGRRIAISCVIVVALSVAFASQDHALLFDLLFAAWLAYMLAFTYVRYGLLDRSKRNVESDDPDPPTG